MKPIIDNWCYSNVYDIVNTEIIGTGHTMGISRQHH